MAVIKYSEEPNVYVYAIGLKDGDTTLPFTKIGVSHNVYARLTALATAQPFEVFCEKKTRFRTRQSAADREREIHRYLSDVWARGEWFRGIPSDIVSALGDMLGEDAPFQTWSPPKRTPMPANSIYAPPDSKKTIAAIKKAKKPFVYKRIDWSKAP